MRPIIQIIIHCSDTPATMDVGAAEIRRWHTSPPPAGNGWADIGYHGVIRRDGTAESGRPLDTPGAHCAGHNARSVGICLVGGRGPDGRAQANFTSAQFATLERQVRGLLKDWPEAEVLGHRDIDRSKACPCFDAAVWWRECVRSRGRR